MESQHTPNDIKRLTYKFVKSMIERTNRDLNIPLKFVEIYKEACTKPVGITDQFDETNPKMR
jgi:hypothetical protein